MVMMLFFCLPEGVNMLLLADDAAGSTASEPVTRNNRVLASSGSFAAPIN